MAAPGLFVDIQRRLESFYALEPEPPVTDFVIDGASVRDLPGGGSRTLVTQDGEDLEVGVVLDAGVHADLAASDPRVRLDGSNLAALCVLTEEISHFLYLLFCARSQRTVTCLELELQGELDKYLTAAFLLSLQNDGTVSARLRELLFQSYALRDGLTAEEADRYRAASRLAFAYSGYLEERYLRGSRTEDLRREARRFYRLGQSEKLERIARLGAASGR